MRGGPSESACRGRFQTTFKWLWSKAMVVSIEGKGSARTESGDRQEEDRKGTTVEVSKGSRDDVKNRGVVVTAGTKLRRNLFTGGAASGMKGGLSLLMRQLSGTWEPGLRC
jgi:hypothetical protein